MDYSPETDCMLGYGTVLYPKNEKQMQGVHINIIYGDFFFTEEILKLLGYGGCYSMEFAGVADEDEIERVLTRMADHFA